MKKKIIFNIPPPPKYITNFDEVRRYLQELYDALMIADIKFWKNDVYSSTTPPSDDDGEDGDIYIVYE